MQKIDIIRIYEKKRCLVVDDLTEVRASYKRMLKSFGAIDVDTAANGDEAIQKCETNHYELILCDYNLADSKDGQQVLEELRHRELLKYTTLFIIITAEMSREMVLGAIENQPDDYITKPISQQTMRLRVDRAVIKHENLLANKTAIEEKDTTTTPLPKHYHLQTNPTKLYKQSTNYKMNFLHQTAHHNERNQQGPFGAGPFSDHLAGLQQYFLDKLPT